jgi:hypothetical protein
VKKCAEIRELRADYSRPPASSRRRASVYGSTREVKMTPLKYHAFVAALLHAARTLKKGDQK